MEFLNTVVEYVFGSALFINAILFIPQAVKIFKDKTANGVSLLTFLGFLLIQFTVVLHGLIHHDYLLVGGYLLSMLTCGVVVILIFVYGKRPLLKQFDNISLEEILKQSPGHIYWKNKEGVSLGCNTNNWRDFGLSSLPNYVGKTDYDLFPKEQADKLRQADLETMRTGALNIVEEEGNTVGGKVRLFLSHKAPLRNHANEIIGIVGVSLDITDTRKTEIERLEFLENVIALMPGHVYWKDKEGVLLGCNDLQAKSAGFASRHQLIGKTDYDMSWKDQADNLRKIDQEVMRTGKSKTIEEISVLADGKKAIFLSQKVPLRNSKREIVGILGISFDITEKKKAEQELQETKHKLEGMTLVSASIAHELRTPLASLNINTNILKDCLPTLVKTYETAQAAKLSAQTIDKKRYQQLEHIISSMELEIRSTLTFIDMQLVNLKPSVLGREEEIFSIRDCIQEAVIRYPFEPGERELLHFDSQHDFQVKGQKMLLIHLLFNLIKNALYYIAVADKGNITIWLECAKGYNRVYFKDTGAGIPQTSLPKIFDRFFTKTPHGAGIGLTFCKMVMQSLGGEITCESVEGEYAVFQLTFPKNPIQSGLRNDYAME